MTIKKAFVPFVELLEANKDKKVKDILEELALLASSKKATKTYIMDANNKPFAVFCWYHQQWELVSDVEYGKKKGTKTGLSTMCKVGTSHWTKAQALAKKESAQLLTDVASGKLDPSKLVIKMDAIEKARTTINKTNMPKGVSLEHINKLLAK